LLNYESSLQVDILPSILVPLGMVIATFGAKYNAKVNVYDSPYKNGSSFYKTLIQVK
jgi:hypothetical protein